MSYTHAEIEQEIVRIYRQAAPGGAAPSESGRGELDSMAFLEFITLLESNFDVIIPAEDVLDENFATTAATAQYIASKLVEAQS